MRFSFELKDFTEQQINPGKAALISEEETLSWLEFETRVNELCRFFAQQDLDATGRPLMIYGHKQSDMIVAVYACMKMQVPYIPVDIIYPPERILAVQQISGADTVLNCTQNALSLAGTTEIALSRGHIQVTQEAERGPRLPLREGDPLVYLIFTSGSTGEPKGVQISTEAVQSFIRWMSTDFGFSDRDVFVNVAIFSFDLSVYELMTFGALGATLLLNDRSTTENPELFLERIQKHGGTVWVSTPSFAFIYSRIGAEEKVSSLRFFLFCGEVLPHPLAAALCKAFPEAAVYNTYGPTEATVATTLVRIDEAVLEKYNPLPVGYPKPESRLLIEDGEIVIVGKNVSVGYLNRPDLNAQKFVPLDGERAFRTGDKGYFQDDMLFCSGRSDDQVKLHGYRIELNEITSQINRLAFVGQAETIALQRNGEVKKIVSLVELKPGTQETERELLRQIGEALAQTLPVYMIPSDIRIIERIPLNQNGKADKKQLTEIYLNG
ncbi:MAG: AMP-binding protein [Flavobacteriales bacterium]